MKKTMTSRREFLKTSGAGFSFALLLGAEGIYAAPLHANQTISEKALGAWVRIRTDNTVLIYNPAAEMGQGSMTALPALVAEELDADWDLVHVEHAPNDPATYGLSWRPGGPGVMMTVGSRTVPGYFTDLRKVGAQIRALMLQHAAPLLDAPVASLYTSNSYVYVRGSDQKISYGEIVSRSELPAVLPPAGDIPLKKPADFKLIGKDVPRVDIPDKVNGTAQFAFDVQLPDLQVAQVVRSPVHGGKPLSYNKEVVENLPGISHSFVLEHGIALVGPSMHQVSTARTMLEVEWDYPPLAKALNSQEKLAGFTEIPGSGSHPSESVFESGNFKEAFSKAFKSYQADYFSDHVYHAQMEPLGAVVSLSESKDAVEVWVGTQSVSSVLQAITDTLGIPESQVTLHPCYLGGGFGRRSTSDYLVEALEIAKRMDQPVKLVWQREDDLQYGMFRPMNLQHMAAGVNEEGQIDSWFHCIVGDGGGLLSSGARNDFYTIPNQTIERCSVDTGIRLKHWRAVGHGFNKFAIEAFIDEIALDQGVDPYQYRRQLMRDHPRARHVLDRVARMCGWGEAPPAGRARGIAFGERSDSLAAGVAEISVDERTGKIKVHRFWCAVDCGVVVQPDNAHAQIEGGIVTGLSSNLLERVTIKDGMAEQSNFHDYPVLRMEDMPEVFIEFIPSEEHPAGLGEPSTPLTGGAIANAFAALTGKHLRHMPFTPDRVRAILNT